MKGPKLAIVGSCVGCEDLRPLHTKRGAVIPAGCAQKNGKEVGGYTPAWCPELHAATVAHARELLGDVAPDGHDPQWVQGFAAALASVDRMHDCPTHVDDAMGGYGVTVADLRAAKVEAFDLDVIKKAMGDK